MPDPAPILRGQPPHYVRPIPDSRQAVLNGADPLAQGLKAFFSAPVAADVLSSLKLSGNLNQAGVPGQPFAGTGLQFVANDQGLRTIAPGSLKLAFPITIAARFMFLKTPIASANIFGVSFNAAETTPFLSYCIAVNGTGQLSGQWNSAGTFHEFGTPTVVPVVGTFYSVVFTLDVGAQNLYVNGAIAAAPDTQAGSPTYATDATLAIGEYVAGQSRTANMVFVDGMIWNRVLKPAEIDYFTQPETRWNLYTAPKKYVQFGPAPVLDIPPGQYARPRYVGLNNFSPQANGLVAWIPSVQGEFIQVVVPGHGMLIDSVKGNTNIPNRVALFEDFPGTGAPNNAPPNQQASDFGMVPKSSKNMALPSFGNVRSIYGFTLYTDVSGLTDATFVYWIYPLPQIFQEAGYWTWQQSVGLGMTDRQVAFGGAPAQTLTFTNGDPHRRGRWQMITVARTLGQVTVWRDQDLVETGSAVGQALASNVDIQMAIGSVPENSSTGFDGVNALWADFRVYNRAWTQGDVNYAFKSDTRWDYYLQPSVKPWELPLTPTPPPVVFLSRLASLGVG